MTNLPTQGSTSNGLLRGNQGVSAHSHSSQMQAQPVMRSTGSAMASDSSDDDFPPRQLNSAHRPRQRYIVEVPSNRSQHNPALRGPLQGDRHGSSPGNQELQQAPRPTLKSLEPWQTWFELTVRVTNLPENITTWDLWKRFDQEGTVVFIELFDDRQGKRDGNAKIRFSPPPRRAFWALDNVKLPTPDGQGEIHLRVIPDPKKRSFQVQSPIRKSVWYDEILKLYPSSLAFGVMHSPSTMMEMRDAQSLARNDIIFTIDLLRSRIVVTFRVLFKAPETYLHPTEGQTLPGELDRVNKFMFTIPFGQLQNLDRVQVNENQWALVISLDSPPPFFRKRLDPKASHAKDALTWSEFNTWFRQTDIVYDPRRLENAVVTLKKESPVIDIGWFKEH
jgi:RNA-dependent RNA polymerase